jgi:(R,R)-butanediol dehydrogenase/meso-butanediol dehydrogenase/diacetyl reductase
MSRAAAGERAVVVGAGPIGIGAYLGLRALGVEDVVVIEPAQERRAAVAAVGAETVLDPNEVDVTTAVLDRTRGGGVSVVIDAAGAPAGFESALPMLGAGGRLVIVAAFMDPVAFHPLYVFQREIEILHSFAYCNDFEAVLAHLAEGRYPSDAWVEVVPAQQLHEAYGRLERREAMKVLVDVGAGLA